MDSVDYKPVWTIITAKNSGAKKAGNDMIFMLCSEECNHELKGLLFLVARCEVKVIIIRFLYHHVWQEISNF